MRLFALLVAFVASTSAFMAPVSQIAVSARTAEATMFLGKSSAKPAAKKVAAAKKASKKVVKKAAPAKKPAFENPFVGGASKAAPAEGFNAEEIPWFGGFVKGFNLLKNLPK